jgi:RimJ/RimL family protein N-acetyltransferase/ketosteroid isomerase-like protein
VRLEPVDPDRHAAALLAAAAGDERLWDYLPYGPFAGVEPLREHLARQAASEDPLFFAVVDAATGEAAGVVSYLRIEPAHGCIEIGHIWFGAPLQRTPAATETIYLLARHAFDDLGNRRLEWKCDAANARSRRAAERFGFTFEGVFRQHQIVKGRNRDTAWYAMLDGDWPAVRAAFEAWLAPSNFDARGVQLSRLDQLRASGGAVDLIDAYDAAWNAQDIEAVHALHDDAVVFHNHTAGERVEGAEPVRGHIAAIFARWPTLRFTRRRLRCGDGFAVSEWTARATRAADGLRLEWDGVDVFTVTPAGRIARKDVYSTSGTPRVLGQS